MKGKRNARIGLILGLFLLLTGCWDSKELKELAIVMAIGIDEVPETKEYQVSVQVINPGTIASGTTGGGGGQSVTPVTVYSATGYTLFEAIRKASQKQPRELFFPHLQIVIIGEGFAREGIQDLFDLFERSHKARLTTMVLIARGSKAETVVKTLTPLEKIPANSIRGKLKNTSKLLSDNISVEIDDVTKALASEGEPVISGVRIIGDPEEGVNKSNTEETTPAAQLAVQGIALFKDGKLKRWLDGPEARGTVWIKNKMKSTIVGLDCKGKERAAAIEIIHSHTDVSTEIRHGEPIFRIRIKEEGNIGEVKCAIDLSKPTELEKLQNLWAVETKKEVMSAVTAAQTEKSDIFGFGEAVSREHSKAWEKMKGEWSRKFAEAEVDVRVDALIRRTDMEIKPYISDRQKKTGSGEGGE